MLGSLSRRTTTRGTSAPPPCSIPSAGSGGSGWCRWARAATSRRPAPEANQSTPPRHAVEQQRRTRGHLGQPVHVLPQDDDVLALAASAADDARIEGRESLTRLGGGHGSHSTPRNISSGNLLGSVGRISPVRPQKIAAAEIFWGRLGVSKRLQPSRSRRSPTTSLDC